MRTDSAYALAVNKPRNRCSPVTARRRVEDAHADVVEVDRPVDRGAGVGLGDEQHAPLAALSSAGPGSWSGEAGHIGIGAQQPQPRPGDRGEHACRGLAGQGVVAGTEEGEVVVGQPVEEVGRLRSHSDCAEPGGGLGAQLVGERRGSGRASWASPRRPRTSPSTARESGRDLSAIGGVALPVDLDVDPRLAHLAEGGRRGRVRVIALIKDELLVAAVGTAAHHQQRMEDRMDASARRFEVGGHGVDQEGLVVRHDLDDRMGTGPALAIDRGVEAGDRRGAGCPSRWARSRWAKAMASRSSELRARTSTPGTCR
jgi:hypothetical protein